MKSNILTRIIDSNPDLDLEVLAKLLFPENRYPIRALTRVRTGKSLLNEEQIESLASHIGADPGDLFKTTWSSTPKGSKVIFKYGPYVAVFDAKKWTTTLRKGDEVILEESIAQDHVQLSNYIKFLNQIIKDYETKS